MEKKKYVDMFSKEKAFVYLFYTYRLNFFRHNSTAHPEKQAEYEAQKHINTDRKQINVDTFFAKQNNSYGLRHRDQIKITVFSYKPYCWLLATTISC